MVATLDELREARALLDAARAELGSAAPLEVGVMVEVPALALQAEQFAAEVDFFSVGTNDLTQYTMAAERGNAALASLLDGMPAAVLALIAQVTVAAARPRPLGRRLRRAGRRPRRRRGARGARRARAEHGREPDPGRQGGAARRPIRTPPSAAARLALPPVPGGTATDPSPERAR